MKAIRIVLLILIVIGLGLIATEHFWVPTVVDRILKSQDMALQANSIARVTPSKIDEYFFVDDMGVHYLSPYYEDDIGTSLSTSTKTLAGADPATFKRISNFSRSYSSEGMTDSAYYQDKNNIYKFSVYHGMAGVHTSVVTLPHEAIPQ